MPISQAFAALGRIPSGIFVVTVRHGLRETGLLASWVQQCSFDPPLLSLAVRRGRFVADWLTAGAPFTVNVVRDDQAALLSHFGKGFEVDQPAFAGLSVEHRPEAAPILSNALGHLDCRLVHRHLAGDHDLFVAEVLDGKLLNEGKPMVHVRKSGQHY